MRNFLREQDGLGAVPQMSYKGNEMYGTSLGGCFSCCCTYFIMIYIVLSFYAFLFAGRDFDSMILTKILGSENQQVYELSATDIIPAFQILQISSEEPYVEVNNMANWRIGINLIDRTVREDQKLTPVDVITCDQYIEKHLKNLDPLQIASIESALKDNYQALSSKDYFCPDIDGTIPLKWTDQVYEFDIQLSDSALSAYNEGSADEKLKIAARVQNTIINSGVIVQNFNPEFWTEHGFNDYVVTQWFQNNIELTKHTTNQFIGLTKDDCSFFNTKVFDLSQFEAFYNGEDCSTYGITQQAVSKFPTSDEGDPLFISSLIQEKKYTETQWTVQSLDMLLAIIGGLTGLIWDSLSFGLGGYQ